MNEAGGKWRRSRLRKRLRDWVVAALHPSRSGLGRIINRLTRDKIVQNTKWHIRHDLSVRGFFETLNARGVRYAVLRWFDNLPEITPGHDIDILIADDDVERIRDLITLWPGGQRIDLYSETGNGGFSLKAHTPHEMSAFPPKVAADLLAKVVLKDGLVRIPCPTHQFLSLAYHAVYIKPNDTGIPSRRAALEPGKSPTHDYLQTLKEMAARAGIALPEKPTLEDLDEALEAHGWRPPLDTLDRTGVWSEWAARDVALRVPHDATLPQGLTVFFLRERAVEQGFAPAIEALLEAHGFEILSKVDLEGEAQVQAQLSFRGGNWGRGPHPVSGGGPKRILASVDVFPRAVPKSMRDKQPLLANRRILDAKLSVRDRVGRDAKGPSFNALHSTDNADQALHAMKVIFPDGWEAILEVARQAQASIERLPATERVMPGIQRRARVELITLDGKPAIRKVFRRNRVEFLHREVAAMQALADCPYVPTLLAHDDQSFVMEFIKDDWDGAPPLPLPLAQVRQLAAFMRLCAERGLDPIDLMPGKNLMCRDGTIQVLDLEFCYPRDGVVGAEALYALAGAPRDFPEVLPLETRSVFAPYRPMWLPYTGVSMETFLHGTPRQQMTERAMNWPRIKLRSLTKTMLRQTQMGRLALRLIRQ